MPTHQEDRELISPILSKELISSPIVLMRTCKILSNNYSSHAFFKIW